MKTSYDFSNHEEVPIDLRNYLMLVSSSESFSTIPIYDINDFLNGLVDFYDAPTERSLQDHILAATTTSARGTVPLPITL